MITVFEQPYYPRTKIQFDGAATLELSVDVEGDNFSYVNSDLLRITHVFLEHLDRVGMTPTPTEKQLELYAPEKTLEDILPKATPKELSDAFKQFHPRVADDTIYVMIRERYGERVAAQVRALLRLEEEYADE